MTHPFDMSRENSCNEQNVGQSIYHSTIFFEYKEWINLTLGQPHLAKQRGHCGGPPLNPSAELDKTYSIVFQTYSWVLQTKTITKTSSTNQKIATTTWNIATK
jgi:hypothetical protein